MSTSEFRKFHKIMKKQRDGVIRIYGFILVLINLINFVISIEEN